MNATTRIPAALAALAGALSAQSPEPLVIEGQALRGGGTVTGIRFLHLDHSGGLVVQVTTDDPLSPAAVLRRGGYW